MALYRVFSQIVPNYQVFPNALMTVFLEISCVFELFLEFVLTENPEMDVTFPKNCFTIYSVVTPNDFQKVHHLGESIKLIPAKTLRH